MAEQTYNNLLEWLRSFKPGQTFLADMTPKHDCLACRELRMIVSQVESEEAIESDTLTQSPTMERGILHIYGTAFNALRTLAVHLEDTPEGKLVEALVKQTEEAIRTVYEARTYEDGPSEDEEDEDYGPEQDFGPCGECGCQGCPYAGPDAEPDDNRNAGTVDSDKPVNVVINLDGRFLAAAVFQRGPESVPEA